MTRRPSADEYAALSKRERDELPLYQTFRFPAGWSGRKAAALRRFGSGARSLAADVLLFLVLAVGWLAIFALAALAVLVVAAHPIIGVLILVLAFLCFIYW